MKYIIVNLLLFPFYTLVFSIFYAVLAFGVVWTQFSQNFWNQKNDDYLWRLSL